MNVRQILRPRAALRTVKKKEKAEPSSIHILIIGKAISGEPCNDAQEKGAEHPGKCGGSPKNSIASGQSLVCCNLIGYYALSSPAGVIHLAKSKPTALTVQLCTFQICFSQLVLPSQTEL